MNVIKAVFGSGRFAKTAPVFQWDTGDRLQFYGVTLPANYQVHFASSFSGDAWRQPTGAEDAYPSGAKVSHNDKRWISTVDANVWEPGVYGWEVNV